MESLNWQDLRSTEYIREQADYYIQQFAAIHRVEDMEKVTESRFTAALRFAGRNIFPCKLYGSLQNFGGVLSLCSYDCEILAAAAAVYIELCEESSKVTGLYSFGAFSCISFDTLENWAAYEPDAFSVGAVIESGDPKITPESVLFGEQKKGEAVTVKRSEYQGNGKNWEREYLGKLVETNNSGYINNSPSSIGVDMSLIDQLGASNYAEISKIRRQIAKLISGTREKTLMNKLIDCKGAGVNIIAILNRQYGWAEGSERSGVGSVGLISSSALPELPLK